jgi:hypothetical protein
MCAGSAIAGVISLIVKLILASGGEKFVVGIGAAVLATFFVGGLILFFVGLLGEYVIGMNARIMNRPLVIEEERINFDD